MMLKFRNRPLVQAASIDIMSGRSRSHVAVETAPARWIQRSSRVQIAPSSSRTGKLAIGS